jgi:hypothetical protein
MPLEAAVYGSSCGLKLALTVLNADGYLGVTRDLTTITSTPQRAIWGLSGQKPADHEDQRAEQSDSEQECSRQDSKVRGDLHKQGAPGEKLGDEIGDDRNDEQRRNSKNDGSRHVEPEPFAECAAW